jgi:hypothetical protein
MILVGLHNMAQLQQFMRNQGKVIELITKTRVEVDSSWILEDARTKEAFQFFR